MECDLFYLALWVGWTVVLIGHSNRSLQRVPNHNELEGFYPLGLASWDPDIACQDRYPADNCGHLCQRRTWPLISSDLRGTLCGTGWFCNLKVCKQPVSYCSSGFCLPGISSIGGGQDVFYMSKWSTGSLVLLR